MLTWIRWLVVVVLTEDDDDKAEPDGEHSFFRATPTNEDLERFHCRQERMRFDIIILDVAF